jgi:hypothetical protein
MRSRRPIAALLSTLSAALVIIATTLMPATQANAAGAAYHPSITGDDQPQGCPSDQGISFQNVNKHFHIPAGIEFKSGPGGTVHGSIQHNLSVSASIGGTGSVEGSIIIASAKAQLDSKLTLTTSITQSFTYDHDVPNGRYGHIQFGN